MQRFVINTVLKKSWNKKLLRTKAKLLYCFTADVVVVVVVVEASAPKVYPRVTLASTSTLSGSVVRT